MPALRTLVVHGLERLRASYWFIPSLMALGAIALAWLAVSVDSWVVAHEIQLFPGRLLSFDTAGARAFLATVAGSMMTVAGVAFSITIVAMTLASQQFGPRLLGNFMRDRGNQLVLGTFIATFLYCLLLLPALRRFREQDALPELALSLALIGTLGSLGVFIYFIHHAATSIRVQTMIDRVSEDVEAALRSTWRDADEPDRPAAAEAAVEEREEAERERTVRAACERGRPVLAGRSGYVQTVDDGRLVDLARDADAVIRRDVRAGRYVLGTTVLARLLVAGGPEGERSEDEELERLERLEQRVRGSFEIGSRRSLTQDVEAAAGQLVELAVRALSPGVNDPITAAHCVDVLAGELAKVLDRRPPPTRRSDADGRLRLLVPATGFSRWLGKVYDPIRQAARGDATVTLRLLDRLADLARQSRRDQDREAIRRQAGMVRRAGVEAQPEPLDRERIDERYQRIPDPPSGVPGPSSD